MKYVNPYNTVEFYVGEITEPQTVKIYTDSNTSVDIEVSEGNKWYTYALPKDEGLCIIEGDSVKNVVVKSNISYEARFQPPFTYGKIIPSSTIEASFKGSNTSKVTHMGGMFYGCSGLTSLDLSNFDTSNVTDMDSVFNGCRGLTSLDLRNFNTSNVTNMNLMFNTCSKLTSLDLSNFNTSKVTNMTQMFNFCSNLTSLDLSGWNTSNVTDMTSMFYNCSGLTSLDLSKWDISEGTIINNMFEGCSNSLTIRMKGCSEDTINKVTSVKPSSASISTE